MAKFNLPYCETTIVKLDNNVYLQTGGQFMGLIQVWIAMQRTVCGQVYITDDDLIKYQQTLNLSE